MLETIIDIYMIINVVAFSFLIYIGVELEEWWVYTWILDIMDDYRINLAGKIIMFTVITVCFLPATLAWYALACLIYILCGLFKLFCKIFREK